MTRPINSPPDSTRSGHSALEAADGADAVLHLTEWSDQP
ncbi:hypothetical protein JOM49_005100 [Amycolatopsis magusensis]|uniref:Uncharacterized protein n=1 Tax=Amycolatopsis magusensis TaxID=882444 RepID=A0ABS4PVX2_9PSEU|nr:hypothetical protein [Amycolatopsis magusensis]